jgi:hypothetical protein
MKKIYVFCQHAEGWGKEDVVGYAIAEDGTGIASHLSSNIAWSKHDMGITSDWKHDNYKEHYPDGYELEWVDNPDTHEGLKSAMELNEKLYQAKINNPASFSIEVSK